MNNRFIQGRKILMGMLFLISMPVWSQQLLNPSNGGCVFAEALDVEFEPATISPTTVNDMEGRLVCRTHPSAAVPERIYAASSITDISGGQGSRLQAAFDITGLDDEDSKYYCLAEFQEGVGNDFYRIGRVRVNSGYNAPEVTVDQANMVTTENHVVITGGAIDPNRVSVSIPGQHHEFYAPQDPDNPLTYMASSQNNGGVLPWFSWSQTVTDLEPGINEISVYSSDCNDGNDAASVTVTYQTGTAPAAVPFDDFVVTPDPSGVAINLDWSAYDITAADPDVFQFKIYQSDNANIDPANDLIQEINSPGNTYQITGLVAGATYYIGIVAYNSNDSPMQVKSVTTVDSQVPAEVSQLVAYPNLNDIRLVWDASSSYPADVDGYKIYLNGAPTPVASVAADATSYDLTGIDNSVDHTIRVTTFDAAGNESAGVELTGYTYPANPSPLSFVSVQHESMMLSWFSVADGNAATVTGYFVYHSDTPFSDIYEAGVSRLYDYSVTPETDPISESAGTTKYYAVTTENSLGFKIPTVQSQAFTFQDLLAPPFPENVTVDNNTLDSFRLSWTAPAAPDLAGFRVVVQSNFDGTDLSVDLPAETLEYTVTGLSECSSYSYEVNSVDDAGNVSNGSFVPYTFTQCPVVTGLVASPQVDQMVLNWDALVLQNPEEGVVFDVYMSQSPFSNVGSMQPVMSWVSGQTATVENLEAGTMYHFAVVARSPGDDESGVSVNPAVTSIARRTLYNITPPTINSVQFNGIDLIASPAVNTITESGTIEVNVTDDIAVARVEFASTSGALNVVDGNGGEDYSAFWDINTEADGPTTLTIQAFDTVNNEQPISFNINIALAPPAVPAINQPLDGSSIGELQTTVVVQSVADVTIDLEVNGVLQTGLPVDQNGGFQQLVSLQDGANTIRARAVNSRGTASAYTTTTVTVDQNIPGAPSGLNAQAKADGVVRLIWNPDTDGTAVAYHVYRSTTPTGTQTRITGNNPVTAPTYDDLTLVDAEYFYQVTGVSAADNEGPKSGMVAATSDSTAPTGSIVYDPVQATYGSGQVGVELTLTEPLSQTPFLSIVPDQGGTSPIIIDLTAVSAEVYVGTMELGGQGIDSSAFAVMTAYDEANNLGSIITSGQTIQIDTVGPDMVTLEVAPDSPIRYTNGDSITVNFTLSEAADSTPQLWYQLSGGPVRDEVEITGLSGSGASWSATFTLPNGAGLSEAETLSFRLLATDATGNSNSDIALNNQFQVYQTALPPLEAPQGLAATSLSAGQVRLTWFPVLNAAQYELYRKPVGSGGLVSIGRTTAAETEWFDTPADGDYVYAVASVRSENGDEAVSGTSLTVIATADSVAPIAPQNLTLSETGNGIQAQWDPNDPADEVAQYRLYRNTVLILEHINPNNLINGLVTTTDGQPLQGTNDYVVTAMDAVGNESADSNLAQITPGLLPVHDFHITVDDNLIPALSWAHNSATEFDVYHINNGNPVKLSGAAPILQTTFNDSTYTGSGRVYSVVAIDGSESLPNTLRLPDLSADMMVEQSLKRGLINELFMVITNHESQAIDQVSLSLTINGQTYQSNEVMIPGFGSTEVSLVIAGDLPADVDHIVAPMTIHHRPTAGSSANIQNQLSIPVEEGGLIISITTNNFVRGTTGEVQLLIQNPGEQSVDLITARNTGSQDSGDVHLRLEDQDGNTLAVAGFRQVLGNNVFTFPSGETIARIPAGTSYLSSAQPINIPANAGDHVVVIANIDQMYYDYGSGQPVTLQGVETRHPTVLANTSYYGELLSISNDLIVDGGSTDISGRAVSRDSGQPVADVPLNLSLRNEGFEQNIDVFTDANGQFVYTYVPGSNEAGVYQVSVTHPDILDRPMDGSFQVGKIFSSFDEDQVRIPFNVETQHVLYVRAPRGLEYLNVRAEVDSLTPANATVVFNDVIAELNHASGWQPIDVTLSVPGSGSLTGQLQVKLFAENAGNLELGTAVLDFEAADGMPDLRSDPQFIYTATNPGVAITEIFELSNQGFADALNVSMEIVDLEQNSAPDWIAITSNAQIDQLSIYETQQVAVTVDPPATMDETVLNYRIRITGDNITGFFEVPLVVLVTLSETGSIKFQTANVYTDPDADPANWLDGVRIKLTSEIDPDAEHIAYTDSNGEVLFTDVTAGRYRYHASKSNHEDLTGRIRILPDYVDPDSMELVSQDEFLFMHRNFITIDWSVTEISIEDRYEVVMNATFETNVPAPVVLISPTVTNLPDMYPGDVYTGLLEIKNVGLLRAFDFALNYPDEDEYFIYEVLGEVPEVIEAGESFFLPFKLINKQTLVPGADGQAGGGGCHGYTNQINGAYKFQCPSGEIDGNASPSFVTYTAGSDCANSGVRLPKPPRNSRDGGPLDFRCWQDDAALWCGGPGANEESTQCAPECEGDQCCE